MHNLVLSFQPCDKIPDKFTVNVIILSSLFNSIKKFCFVLSQANMINFVFKFMHELISLFWQLVDEVVKNCLNLLENWTERVCVGEDFVC
jgi:phage-related protein